MNNKGIGKGELFFILSLALPLVPMGIFGQWWLFGVFAVFYVIFGLMELWSVKKDDKTISQRFWDFSIENKWKAWLILGSMVVMWIALIWHLAIEML